MSLKTKILAAGAVLALAVPLSLAGTTWTASAGTPSCGHGCLNIFPREYSGTTLGAPQFVVDVLRQGVRQGQPLILFRSANFDPAEDWSLAFQGTVADFYAANLVSSATALHYGCVTGSGDKEFPQCAGFPNLPAFEIEYAPFGVDSGLCMGLASTAFQGEGVTLQPCGASSRTVWIQDACGDGNGVCADAPVPPYYAAINGSNGNFSDPFVLTYPHGYPTDKPRVQLTVQQLTGFTGPVSNDSQLWTGVPGVLP